MISPTSLLRGSHRFSRLNMIVLLGAGLVAASAVAQEPPIDPALAKQYFAEAKAASDRDNGGLWKVPLCGPLLSWIAARVRQLRIKQTRKES